MKKIILVIFLSLVLVSCENEVQDDVKNEIKEETQVNIDTGIVLESEDVFTETKQVDYSSKLSLKERVKLINKNESVKEEKYLEKVGSIEGSKIKIIRGDNNFDYSFKHIEKTGIELYGTGLSENIKTITVTPIIYNLVDGELTENDIYTSDYIDKEPFTLKGYKAGDKSFKYNAFYKYKVFTPTGGSYRIDYNFKNGKIDSDFIFIYAILGKINSNVKLLGKYMGFIGKGKFRMKSNPTRGPFLSYIFDLNGNIWTDYGYGIIKNGFDEEWKYACGMKEKGYIIVGGPDYEYNENNSKKILKNSNFNYNGYAQCGNLFTLSDISKIDGLKNNEIILNKKNINNINSILQEENRNNGLSYKGILCFDGINSIGAGDFGIGFTLKFYKNEYEENHSYLFYDNNNNIKEISHCEGVDGTTITYYGTYKNGEIVTD